jgi:hypothetical protein
LRTAQGWEAERTYPERRRAEKAGNVCHGSRWRSGRGRVCQLLQGAARRLDADALCRSGGFDPAPKPSTSSRKVADLKSLAAEFHPSCSASHGRERPPRLLRPGSRCAGGRDGSEDDINELLTARRKRRRRMRHRLSNIDWMCFGMHPRPKPDIASCPRRATTHALRQASRCRRSG